MLNYHSEQIPGTWPGCWSQNQSQHQETWAQETPSNVQQYRNMPQALICPGEACHCNETRIQLGQREQELAKAMAEIKALKVQLFDTWKITKQYDDAEIIYRDILVNHSTDVDMPKTIIALQYSFAEMLMEQNKFAAAETVAEQVWEARKALDPSSELSRMSHRQICLIYSSLGKFEKAESRHRTVYHQEPKDAWTLENGDGVCRQLVKRGLYQEAAVVQLSVWRERQKLEAQGPRHDSTIRSGLERISILEQWSATLAGLEGIEVQNESNRNRKHFCEGEIDESLKEIWGAAEKPEHSPELLDVGHKLGSRFLAQKRYAEAEAILEDVWAGMKANFGEASKESMLTGRLLAKALKLPGLAEKYQRAVVIYEKILAYRKAVFGESDDKTVSVGADLAGMYSLLGQYAEAERVYQWVLEQRVNKLGQCSSKTLEARYNLGRTIYTQGRQRYGYAGEMLREVYDAWYVKSPKGEKTLQCGLMLVETLAEQAAIGPIQEVLGSIQHVFNGRAELPERDRLYLESGLLFGKSLLGRRKYREAQDILLPLWDSRPELYEEKQVRLECGHLYGQSLLEVNDYPHAKVVLESVRDAQNETLGSGSSKVIEISRLLQLVEARTPKTPRNRRVMRWS